MSTASDRCRNNRLDGAGDHGDGSVISQLLLKDSRSCYGVLNAGEDDQMFISGYRRSIPRTALCWTLIILTCGLLRLIMHWWRHWHLLATHSECPLDIAEKVLIREEYQGKHRVYYVKEVMTVNVETIKQMRNEKHKWDKYFTTDESFDESQFRMSVHFSDGNFKHLDTIRLFRCKQLRYVWDMQTQAFLKLRGLDTNISSLYLHQRKGLSPAEEFARRIVYGLNQIATPVRGIFTLLFLEVLNPFYVFQVFSVCLWVSYNYYYYAVVIVLMSAFGITMSIIQTTNHEKALRDTVQNSDCAIIVHEDETTERVETQYLVPGDIIEIPSSGCTMQCDAVLLSGNCILDESMLTGESVPVTKTPLPRRRDVIYDTKEHSRHTLFCGTQVIQTRYIGTEKVLAVVINTGNITAKGGLIRSILYPPAVDYKFEKDSYKFITLLAVIATVGFLYTLVTKIIRQVSASKIAIESLDLITIAVPPALPAAMTVGRFYAQKRLKHNNIYCISPRSINVSGSIDCVCFDKTGTLTEDGLDMWGVVPKSSTNQFQIPVKQVERLPLDHFLFGMVTCHSITIMNGELKGDPLDLKMFESTGWILEEANVADDAKYDLLFPTIVRQPKNNKSQSLPSIANGNGNEEDLFANSNDIGIVREFSFTSSLQRMSVITRRLSDNHFNVYCKGSPEMIHSLCRPETLPENYHSQLDIYAQQGYRIIAIAYKALDKKLTYPKIQRISRDQIECDLEFQGFVVLENRLKPDTTSVIKTLSEANIRTVMVTGDNILTAISVAKDCGIIKKKPVIIVNTRPHAIEQGKYEIYYNLSGGGNKCTGASNIPSPNTNGDVLSLMTNSNSVASLETTDTWTHHDVELGLSEPNGNAFHPYIEELTTNHNNYCFAMVGKTWAIIREHFPDLLKKFVTRGSVFARMSPDQKQALILELENLGYYVAMCGDGANDCGALKAAHTGISLSEAESSVASPFTSKNPTIACVPNVIKEGRAALVTSFGIFKYMAAYSLVQFTSVLILYSIDSNLTDLEFLYIDLFLISVFAFFFGKTESYDGPLVKETPLNSLISLSPVASLLLHIAVAIGFQVGGWYHIQSMPWFQPFNLTESNDEFDLGCMENYTIFSISCFQYIILAYVFSKGAPYRKSVLSNRWFLGTLIVNTLVVVYLVMIPHEWIAEQLELIVPNDYNFRAYMLLYGFINFLISLFIEEFIVDFLLFKKLRYKFHNIEKSRRKYLSVENELRKDFAWPPLTYYITDMNFMSNEKSSPVSYAEIHAEQGLDMQTPFDQNSVLNSFFDKADDELDHNKNDVNSNDSDSENAKYNTNEDTLLKAYDDKREGSVNDSSNINWDKGNSLKGSCTDEANNDSGIDFDIMLNPLVNSLPPTRCSTKSVDGTPKKYNYNEMNGDRNAILDTSNNTEFHLKLRPSSNMLNGSPKYTPSITTTAMVPSPSITPSNISIPSPDNLNNFNVSKNEKMKTSTASLTLQFNDTMQR